MVSDVIDRTGRSHDITDRLTAKHGNTGRSRPAVVATAAGAE